MNIAPDIFFCDYVGAIGVLAAMSFVCIVDDDASVRSGVGNLLKAVGYTAVTFSSGEEFLASPEVDDALCVLLDVRMQGMPGLEVQRQLNAEGRNIPVVFMSAHGDDVTVARALRHGAISFLRKPFAEEVLLDSIELAIGRRNGAA
ncbi:response regulator [Paraburkholderia sp. RL17-383-BIF-A]|uniref:response regulator transcription factor n=1 Tax=Burkholderiaceae TaxID=119060 RepID=UPI000A4989C9|nr:response regulator [Burkholderia sp. WP9]